MSKHSPYFLHRQDLSHFHRVEAGRFFLRGQVPFVDPYAASALICYHTPTLAEFALVNTSGGVPFVSMRSAVAEAFRADKAERVFMQRVKPGRGPKPVTLMRKK